MKRLLFICSRNRLRSPTAEEIFADYPGIETDSAGIRSDAEIVLSEEQIEWADVIVAMEKVHREKAQLMYPTALRGKKISVLAIPDNYQYMEPKLIDLLKKRCAQLVR